MRPETGCLVTFAAYDGYKSCDITTFNVSKGSISFSLQIFNKVVGEPAVSINRIRLKFPVRQLREELLEAGSKRIGFDGKSRTM